MQLTRQQITEYLQVNRMATSIELSHALKVTSANIRHHLKLLEATGVVEVVGNQPGRGRGRPMKLYQLTENALSHNLEGLTSALLKSVFENTNSPQDFLTKTARNILGNFQTAANIHTRLNQAVEQLTKLKYQASWEASPKGPRIILRNCPYAVIIEEHPELCQMDAALLSCLLDQSVEQTAKLERSPDGTPHCIFITR